MNRRTFVISGISLALAPSAVAKVAAQSIPLGASKVASKSQSAALLKATKAYIAAINAHDGRAVFKLLTSNALDAMFSGITADQETDYLKQNHIKYSLVEARAYYVGDYGRGFVQLALKGFTGVQSFDTVTFRFASSNAPGKPAYLLDGYQFVDPWRSKAFTIGKIAQAKIEQDGIFLTPRSVPHAEITAITAINLTAPVSVELDSLPPGATPAHVGTDAVNHRVYSSRYFGQNDVVTLMAYGLRPGRYAIVAHVFDQGATKYLHGSVLTVT